MQKISRIYIRLPNWIGDVCMSLPCLEALATTGCQIVICAKAWAKPLLAQVAAHDFITLSGKWHQDYALIRADLNQHQAKRHSVGLILPDSMSSALCFRLAGLRSCGYIDEARSCLLRWPIKKPQPRPHAVEHWYYLTQQALRLWGFNVQTQAPRSLHLPLSQESRQLAQELLDNERLATKSFVLIAPTATGVHKGQNKVWPHFNELTEALQQRDYTVVMSPPMNELDQAMQNAPAARLIPALNLPGFVALIEQAALVICNDSGVSHLAATTQTPMMTLIGVTNPTHTAPWNPNAYILGQEGQWPTVDEVLQQALAVLG